MVRDLKPFCLRCDAFTEVEDAGDPAHPICSRCRHRDVEFRPITPLRPPPPDPVPTPNGPHERSLLSKKRLPPEKRSLSKIAAEGCYTCPACGEITEPADSEGELVQVCVLCGGGPLSWTPPAFDDNQTTNEATHPLAHEARASMLHGSNTQTTA